MAIYQSTLYLDYLTRDKLQAIKAQTGVPYTKIIAQCIREFSDDFNQNWLDLASPGGFEGTTEIDFKIPEDVTKIIDDGRKIPRLTRPSYIRAILYHYLGYYLDDNKYLRRFGGSRRIRSAKLETLAEKLLAQFCQDYGYEMPEKYRKSLKESIKPVF